MFLIERLITIVCDVLISPNMFFFFYITNFLLNLHNKCKQKYVKNSLSRFFKLDYRKTTFCFELFFTSSILFKVKHLGIFTD